ncbi:MAG: PD40 domain-containing protein, partial [Calditrichaeota bacterium]|nr:PD40 domain-containing protein [Calditrichota bacterium]
DILKRIDPGLSYFNDPQFSPDGQQIVFRGATEKFKKDAGYLDELYLMNADGSGLKQITHYPKNDTTAEWWDYHAGPPRWSAALNLISFGSVQQGKTRLYTIKADGSEFKPLTLGDHLAMWHEWSADATWLTFNGTVVENSKKNYDIYLMNRASKEIKRLTTDTLYEQAPVFLTIKE